MRLFPLQLVIAVFALFRSVSEEADPGDLPGYGWWSAYGPLEFKGAPVARLGDPKRSYQAVIFRTRDTSILLALRSINKEGRDKLQSLDLPAADPDEAVKLALSQLDTNPEDGWYKHYRTAAEMCAGHFGGLRDWNRISEIGVRLFTLANKEGNSHWSLSYWSYIADAFLHTGKIAEAKTMFAKRPVLHVQPAEWAKVLDFEKAAAVSLLRARDAMTKFETNQTGNPPTEAVEEAIRWNLQSGDFATVTVLSAKLLQFTVARVESYYSSKPISSSWAENLSEAVAVWWFCFLDRLPEEKRREKWTGLKKKYVTTPWNEAYFDWKFATKLCELGLVDEGEKILRQLALPDSGLTQNYRAGALANLAAFAEQRENNAQAFDHYRASLVNAQSYALRDHTLFKCLELSLKSNKLRDIVKYTRTALDKGLSAEEKKKRSRSRGSAVKNLVDPRPFSLAAIVHKTHPSAMKLTKFAHDDIREELLRLAKYLPEYRDHYLRQNTEENLLKREEITAFTGLALAEYGELEKARALILESTQLRRTRLQPLLRHPEEKVRISANRQMSEMLHPLWRTGLNDELLDLLYQNKATVLDGVIRERRMAAEWPAGRQLLDELQKNRARLIDLQLRGGESADRQILHIKQANDQLAKRLDYGTAQLEVLDQAGSKNSTYRELRNSLPVNTLLVEYLVAPSPLGIGQPKAAFFAFAMDGTGNRKIIRLDRKSIINREIMPLRHMGVRNVPDEAVEQSLTRLYSLLVKPVKDAFPSQTRWIVAPDDALYQIPFVALLDEERRFFGESTEIRYVRAARLVGNQPGPVAISKPTVSIYFRPDYTVESTLTATRSGGPTTRHFFRNIQLADLPGTETEAKKIASILSGANWDVKGFKGIYAAEHRLRKTGSPKILHLATHGFYFPANQKRQTPLRGVIPDTPDVMLRTGLFLAGSQQTLESWSTDNGEAPPGNSDGVVFAAEIAGMNLKQTDLVVLSACETGLGEVESGEGIMGFGRALEAAGARNTLLTLWPVDDDATADLMARFYQNVSRGMHYGQALQIPQIQMLKTFRASDGISRSIALAAPFQLTGTNRTILD